MDEPILILRSSRKTLALEIRRDGTLLVRAPGNLPRREIQRFLREKEDWIRRHLAQMEQRREAAREPYSPEQLRAFADRAKEIIPQKLSHFAPLVGVDYGKVTIRSQHSRWGSCSSKGNLNFNCLVSLCPPEVVDYVVVHELCHRKQMNHSAAFWSEVERVLPDYRLRKQWLKDHGTCLIDRLP